MQRCKPKRSITPIITQKQNQVLVKQKSDGYSKISEDHLERVSLRIDDNRGGEVAIPLNFAAVEGSDERVSRVLAEVEATCRVRLPQVAAIVSTFASPKPEPLSVVCSVVCPFSDCSDSGLSYWAWAW